MTIHPQKGVDLVAFGMTRSEVELVVGHAPRRARRNEYDASDYDFFQKLGLFVYHDAGDKCSAVELARDARVSYYGYELFAHPAHEVRAWARARDPGLDDKDDFVSTAPGLSTPRPSMRRSAPSPFRASWPFYQDTTRRNASAWQPHASAMIDR